MKDGDCSKLLADIHELIKAPRSQGEEFKGTTGDSILGWGVSIYDDFEMAKQAAREISSASTPGFDWEAFLKNPSLG